MTAAVGGALLAMAYAATRERAQECAQEAARRGATPEQLAAAWVAWERVDGESVQLIGVAPKCLCSHVRTLHEKGRGDCWAVVCGCSSYRPAEVSA